MAATQSHISKFINAFLSVSLSVLPLTYLIGDIPLLTSSLVLTANQLMICCLLVAVCCWLILHFNKQAILVSNFSIALIIITVTCSSIWARPFTFININHYLGELSVFTLLSFLLYRQRHRLLPFLLIVTMFGLSYLFIKVADGRVLTSDDHSTFLYRLEMLAANFPYIPFYNPLWNAGIDERYFFATGSLNIFFLLAPLIYHLDLWDYYNLVPIFINFILLPLCSYIAARLIGLTNQGACWAGLLAICSSISWFNWSLHFGPLGFLTTTCLAPLVAALVLRALDPNKKITIFEALALVVTGSLLLFWSPGGLVFIPIILLGIRRIYLLWQKPILSFVLLMLIVLNLPWILVFWSASNVSHFLDKTEGVRKVNFESNIDGYAKPEDDSSSTDKNIDKDNSSSVLLTKLHKAKKHWQSHAGAGNLLLLTLACVALVALPSGKRLFYSTLIIWLLFLGTCVATLKPQLELDRMLVVLFIMLAVPVASLVDTLCKSEHKLTGRITFSIFFAITAAYLLTVANIIRGNTYIPMQYRTVLADNLINAIDRYTTSGRSLFAGFILHELDGGHIAPLTLRSKTPLIASSQVHKYWRYTDVIPHEFLAAGDAGIEKYFDLLNVTTVIAHDPTWRKRFFNNQELYQPVWQERRFTLFSRVRAINSYFLEGSGEIIEQNSNSVLLIAKQPSVVIKFNYFPFLTSSQCKLSPQEVATNINFIRLEECPIDQPIIIKSDLPHARIQL